jgi:N-acetylmuramoyl-L-alanine amidase
MKKNSIGAKVTDLQQRLKLLDFDLGSSEIDGVYGGCTEDAVKKFQQDRGLLVSGIVDQETWQELVDAGYKIGDRLLYLKNPPFRGDDVKILQLWLKTLGFYPFNENGIFCEKTRKALVEFQDNMNIDDDGIMGKQTLHHLKSIQRIIVSKETSNFPYIKNNGKSKLNNKYSIILDFSTSPEDKSWADDGVDIRFLKEKLYICRNIMGFCRDELNSAGFEVMTTTSGEESHGIFLFDRIENANKSDADYLISINLNHSSDTEANGCSCYYFKGLKSYSIEGFQLSNMIQNKLIDDLKVLDCRVHGSSYAILKNTSMTSVLVEPAFISNKKQKKDLEHTGYQKKIGKSIVAAIIEYIVKG